MKSQLFHLTTFFRCCKKHQIIVSELDPIQQYLSFYFTTKTIILVVQNIVFRRCLNSRDNKEAEASKAVFCSNPKNVKEKTDQELKPKGNFYRSETRNLKCPSLPFFPMGPKEKVTSERKNSFMFQLGSGEIPILSIISITICGQNDTHTIWRVYNSVTIFSFKNIEIAWITHSLKKSVQKYCEQ